MSTVKKIAAGLLICVPVLLIVLPLLSSADMVFNHYLINFTRIWEYVDIGPAARHGLIILFVFVYLYGYIWSFYTKPPAIETEKPFLIALGHAWYHKIPVIKAYIVIALIFYTVLNFINVDKIIARNNIDRYFRTGEIDINYMQTLSYDAIPDMLILADDSNQEIYRQVKEYMLLKKQRLSKDEPWQSFNYSRYRAKAALEGDL